MSGSEPSLSLPPMGSLTLQAPVGGRCQEASASLGMTQRLKSCPSPGDAGSTTAAADCVFRERIPCGHRGGRPFTDVDLGQGRPGRKEGMGSVHWALTLTLVSMLAPVLTWLWQCPRDSSNPTGSREWQDPRCQLGLRAAPCLLTTRTWGRECLPSHLGTELGPGEHCM